MGAKLIGIGTPGGIIGAGFGTQFRATQLPKLSLAPRDVRSGELPSLSVLLGVFAGSSVGAL